MVTPQEAAVAPEAAAAVEAAAPGEAVTSAEAAAAVEEVAAAVRAQAPRPPPAVARAARRRHATFRRRPLRALPERAGGGGDDGRPSAAAAPVRTRRRVPGGGGAAVTGRAGQRRARGRRDHREAPDPLRVLAPPPCRPAPPPRPPRQRQRTECRTAPPHVLGPPWPADWGRPALREHGPARDERATSTQLRTPVQCRHSQLSDGTFFRPPNHRRCQPPSQPS